MKNRYVLFTLLTVGFPFYGALAMSPQELVGRYTSTLAKQQRFAFKYTSSSTMNGQFSSPLVRHLNGRTTMHWSGEAITDGRRVAHRWYSWGRIRPGEVTTRDNPEYIRHTYDGKEILRYIKIPGNKNEPYGWFAIHTRPTRRAIWDAITLSCVPNVLLGYIGPARLRMDRALGDVSTRLVVLNELENIGGADCYVLHFTSKFGRGTLWLDPARGFNIAQAYFNFRSGDIDVDGKPAASGSICHRYLSNVSFELIDGVWFPTGGTTETKTCSRGDHATTVRHHKITALKLNPDMDAMGAFSTADIPDGAFGTYFHGPGQRQERMFPLIWQNGRPVLRP